MMSLVYGSWFSSLMAFTVFKCFMYIYIYIFIYISFGLLQ